MGAAQKAVTSEVLFYHLEHSFLEKVLPALLERTLTRGWRALVKAGTPERLEALDQTLWTYTEDSFLPHGLASAGRADVQPVLLSLDDERANGADICFVVEGADLPPLHQFVRTVVLFDGRNPDAVAQAREQWKDVKAQGLSATYWQQDASGRWVDAIAARDR